MLVVFFNILFYTVLVLPACYFILLQWNEKTFRWNWLGILLIFWNFATFAGNTMSLLGIHNIIYFAVIRVISVVFILWNLSGYRQIERLILTTLVLLLFSGVIVVYPDTRNIYTHYSISGVLVFTLMVIVLFNHVIRLINLNRTKDLRKQEEFWSDIGVILYVTWLSYTTLIPLLSINQTLAKFFLFFGNGAAAFFFLISLKRWSQNQEIKGVFSAQN